MIPTLSVQYYNVKTDFKIISTRLRDMLLDHDRAVIFNLGAVSPCQGYRQLLKFLDVFT